MDQPEDKTPGQPETARAEQSPIVTRGKGAFWLEVFAVLCIAVFPWTTQALTGLIFNLTASEWSALYDALRLFGPSCCIIFAVTYLITRSGEPLSSFGILKPEWIDLLWGAVAWAGPFCIWRMMDALRSHDPVGASTGFQPHVRSAADVAVLAIALSASAIAEELVCSAYLVTRFLQLLRSRLLAILLPAVLYAGYHVQYDLPGIAVVFLSGIWCGLLFTIIHRAVPLALGHLLYNLMQLAASE